MTAATATARLREEAKAALRTRDRQSGAANVDCIYVAAARDDARYTRICIASIRTFYPQATIKLLAGGALEPALLKELDRSWDVKVAAGAAGDYGWGFVKLEPLFGPEGERFLMLDSDTVMTGPILNVWERHDGPFLVDDEIQSEADLCRLYYDWRKVRAVDAAARAPAFVFNSGQWFGTAGVLSRDDFAPWVVWSMPRRLKYPGLFMPGEQGVLNYVLNKKAHEGLRVERRKIMRWPGHGMKELTARAIADGTVRPVIVHWAGMKRVTLRKHVGGDVLGHFERAYFERMRLGRLRRFLALSRHYLGALRVRLRLFAARRLDRRATR